MKATETNVITYDKENKVSIYVPSTVNVNKRIDNKKQVMAIIKQMSLLFGGATSDECVGGWVADNGDIVVAMIEDSATVKRFYKEDGYYRLQPENDTMDPIIVSEVSIIGKVVGLYRSMK